MRKKVKKRIAAVFAVFVTFMAFTVSASAESTFLAISSDQIKAGDSFKVTISSPQTSQLMLHYDGTMVKLTGQGQASLTGNTLTITAKSATYTFEALKAGGAGFVASSDQYERSSVMVQIKESAEAPATGSKEETDADSDKGSDAGAEDSSGEEAVEPDDTAETGEDSAATASSDDTSEQTDSADTSESADTDEKTGNDTAYAKTEVSSSDLTLRELLLDRRVVVILAVMAVVIIILAFALIRSRYVYDDDFEDEAEDSDEEDTRKEIEVPDLVLKKTPDREEKTVMDVEKEKLSMPKTPVNPEKKLKLEDLNDL